MPPEITLDMQIACIRRELAAMQAMHDTLAAVSHKQVEVQEE